MFLDVSIGLSFIFIFFISNIYGWGFLHEKQFLLFSSSLGMLYFLLSCINCQKIEKTVTVAKVILLLLFIGVSVFAVTWNLIFLRNRSLDINYISDSALQTELAGKFVLDGENPYVKDYDTTSLAKWPYADEVGRTVNPALYHNVIPPFLIVASAAGFRVFSRIFGFFDVRIIYLTAFLFVIVLGFIKYRLNHLLLFLILMCMNPLFNINLIKGTNDVVVFSLLLWSLFLLEKKKIVISALLLGISLATKQTAWFAIPFYFFYSLRLYGKSGLRNFATISLLVGFAFYAPFILNNFDRTFRSLMFYPTSHTAGNATTHPIEGFGFSQYIYTLGFVQSIYSDFPFFLFQSLSGIGATVLLFLKYRRHITGSGVLLSTALLTSVIWFFNRYFLETHLAYILVLVSAVYLWRLDEKEKAMDTINDAKIEAKKLLRGV